MAQGRSTKIITMIKWIRTIRLSIKNSLSLLFIILTCNLPVWCDKIKLSNLLLPRKGGTFKSLQLLSTSGTFSDLNCRTRSKARCTRPQSIRVPAVAFGVGV